LFGVTQGLVPADSLLRTYRAPVRPEAWDQYMDCFSTVIARRVTLADYVHAFYTTPVFKLERWIISAAVRLPSTDIEARELAQGTRATFSAWRVLERSDRQILLGDVRDQTRSWLAVTRLESADANKTLLQFGSGIRSVADPATGQPTLTRGFRWLMAFHKRYSEVLLRSARASLRRSGTE
jgi:hypothetical protein